MKKISLFIMAVCLTFGCSKPADVAPNAIDAMIEPLNSYFAVIEDTESVFMKNVYVSISIGPKSGIMVVDHILLEDFGKDRSGNPRPGNHPEGSVLLNSATYKVEQIGVGGKFTFMESECSDEKVDPLTNLIPKTTSYLEVTPESLSFDMYGERQVFYKISQAGHETLNALISASKNATCPTE